MGITLLTGPANAGKAEVLLERLHRHAAHGQEPLLVVPTRADVERYRVELAEGGLIFGARVLRFEGLMREVVRRALAGSPQVSGGPLASEPLSPAMRERMLAQLAAAEWPAAAGSNLARALSALVVELEVARVSPERLAGALARWKAQESGSNGSHGVGAVDRIERLASVYARYRGALSALGRLDPELRASAALDELRRAPALWRGTPVLFYGFDDLTALQLDALETLGSVVQAPLMVSLAYEAGRAAFAGRAATFQALRPLAEEHMELQARADHYAPQSRAQLHRLERELFEQQEQLVPLEGSGVVRLLEGGGERAELELLAAEIRGLIDGGMEPGEIALVHRLPGSVAPLICEVFGSFGIPFTLELRRPFSHTALGRAILGLLTCACGGEGSLPAAESGHLLAWLRAPGLLKRVEFADLLEAKLRRAGLRSAEQARAIWESERWPLDEIDRTAEAASHGPLALIGHLSRELNRLFYLPRRGRAAVLGGAELDDARALAAAQATLGELHELARGAPELLGGAAGVIQALQGLEFFSGDPPGPAAVAVLDPLALRARRVRALLLCGLQEGVFPSNTVLEPLLGEEERRRLAEVSGLRLQPRQDHLAAERYLLYATVSRPEEMLVLSWHTAGEDERSAPRSLFVEDVCDLFDDGLREQHLHRALGAVDWPARGAPVLGWALRERVLSQPQRAPAGLEPLKDLQLLAELREDRLWSASSLELWTRCPASWLVERLLRVRELEPDPDQLRRGSLAHAVLRDVFEGLRERAGSARLSPQHLGLARELLSESLEEHAALRPLSVAPERVPGLRRRLELDLERYLQLTATQEGPLEPAHMELPFGFPEPESLPPLDLGGGLRLRGRIDRVDVTPGGEAVVYDYKGEGAPAAARWVLDGSFQVALYMRAVERLLDHEVLGGLYQPLRGRDLRPRGALRADADLGLAGFASDRLEREEFDLLVKAAVAIAREAAAQADAGALRSEPERCGFGGNGCMYPTICRCER